MKPALHFCSIAPYRGLSISRERFSAIVEDKHVVVVSLGLGKTSTFRARSGLSPDFIHYTIVHHKGVMGKGSFYGDDSKHW